MDKVRYCMEALAGSYSPFEQRPEGRLMHRKIDMCAFDSSSDSEGGGNSPGPPSPTSPSTLHQLYDRQVCAECAALLHSSKPPACWNIIHLFCAGCLERMPARDALRARIRIDLGLKLVCPDCGGTEEAPGEWVDTYSVTSRLPKLHDVSPPGLGRRKRFFRRR
ncbi:PREDICTED: uncharacterized protein LOC109483402 [Branchiostoma belcheri]|uniref:Uncharacterized protein LOC109483402 n=1 Tax=Branchiostoma belcheri TaxID=7741 RepID=A0A6P4ZL80_BRABE|nr:PREDICTED: uncharacterized protein LOC109483402 [Branchiostoma belcheri]KAI8494974.1 hypothetical protein Bbelb_275790 [Branchiostoma belcheri]